MEVTFQPEAGTIGETFFIACEMDAKTPVPRAKAVW